MLGENCCFKSPILPGNFGINDAYAAGVDHEGAAASAYPNGHKNRLRPTNRSVPLKWLTYLAAWDAPNFFIDSQERGPYRAWWHEHRFRQEGDDTHMEDRVFYAAPAGPLGRMAHALSIRRQLQPIFWYRASAITLRFG